ncbi:MAG: hypothetical protein HY796_01510 [Elusimicrobia bacterium]|nr:hypothetical protein [Elusimicrobiota bacterium]
MKTVSILLLLVCAQSIWAFDFEQLRRTASFDNSALGLNASSGELNLAAPEPAARQDDGFIWRRDFCWTRGKELNADRMGMPVTFCITSMELTGGINENPKLKLQGSALSGTFNLKIGPPGDGLFKATAVIFERMPMIQVCAPAEGAYIEFIILIDERGKIVSDPQTKSFYGTTPDTCSSAWNYREIKYEMKSE